MSTHPNVILAVALQPHDLPRKTMKAILTEFSVPEDEQFGDMKGQVEIAGEDYHHEVMESDYDEGWQLSGKEGDLIFFDLITYGYGEIVTWDKLEKRKAGLEAWAIEVCQRHRCDWRIFVTANYW